MTLGLAVGELLTGAWSDHVGRRVPLLIVTAVHVGATAGCALAPTVDVLTALRVVQGFGAAGTAVLVLAIVRDVADGRRPVVLLSRLTLVTTTAPLLAPVPGAELLPLVGRRGIFLVLAAGSAVVLAWTALSVPETGRRPVGPTPLRSGLRVVGGDWTIRRAAAAAIVPLQTADTGLTDLLPCLFLLVFVCGGCLPCATALALSGRGEQAGTATSIHGFASFSVFSVAGVVPPLAGLVDISDAPPLAVVLLCTAGISLAASGLLVRSGRRDAHGRPPQPTRLPEPTPH